jgi:ADP-heptose:LPS heptosyltransferase
VQYWGYQPRSVRSFIQLFSLPRPDWALIPGDNRYGWLAFVRGAKWLIGFTGDRPAYKQGCFDELLALPRNPIAVTDMMQQLCEGQDAAPYQAKQWLFHNQQALPSISTHRPIVAKQYILFHIGAKSAIKHWSTQNWLALADYFKQHNKQVVLSAGLGETQQLDEINAVINLPSYRANLSLIQLIEVMQKAQLIICLDNGIGQLAKVIATPTVCLFGAGSTTLFAEAKFWQDIPYQSVTTAMECRNTQLLFKRKITWIQTCNRSVQNCLQDAPICMNNISVEYVIQAAKTQLAMMKK